MVPVKIECECGQSYAFEVEPVYGRMPYSITCPSCGEDGTAAADEFISSQCTSPDAVAEPSLPSIQISKPAAAPEASSGRGIINRPKAEREAKSKTMWGEPQEHVTSYLLTQGFNRSEAMELAFRLSAERMAIVRSNGIKKIIVGAVLAFVPLIAYIIFKSLGFYLIKLFILSIIVGCTGAYMCISGILMVVSPKSEKGNVVKE